MSLCLPTTSAISTAHMKLDIYRNLFCRAQGYFQAVHENSRAAVFYHTDGAVIPAARIIEAGMDCFSTVQTMPPIWTGWN
jgi:hypothetical protein